MLVGEAEGHVQLNLVLRLVRPVAATALRRPDLHVGEGLLARQFPHIVGDAVFIDELLGVEAAAVLRPENEHQALVDDSLPAQNIPEILNRHRDIGEHLQIWLPADDGAGVPLSVRLLLQAAHVLAPLEMQGVFIPVPAHLHVHVFGGILSGAGAQTVEAQGKLIAFRLVGVVFAASVQLAENQLPVEPLLLLVVVHRHPAAEVLHLDGAVLVPGGHDAAAVALPGLIDGVGQNLEHSVLAALQTVRSEDNTRALAHTVGPFQGGDAVVAVGGLFRCHGFPHSF